MDLKFIKKASKNKLKKDFNSIYDEIKIFVKEKYNYDGELKIISNDKWVNFYIIDDGSYTNNDYEYNIDID